MKIILSFDRLGLHLRNRSRQAVLALAALAVTTARADVVFTRSTQTGEHWAHYTATFTPAVSGSYTLGFNLTAGGPSGDNSILIDAVQVTNGATTVFADGFETPNLGTNTGNASSPGNTLAIGNWAFTNYSGILDGSPPNWGLAGGASNPPSSFTLGSADGTTQYAYLQAAAGTLGKTRALNALPLVAGQTYTVSFYQASRYDFGGTTTYTVTLDYTPPTIHWVNWTGTESVGGVTKYVGQMVVPRTGGGSTTVTVKYTSPPQGIAFFQTSNGTDFFAQGNAGYLGRNPPRSPYTSAKVSNIPDGGGAVSDKGDIIALTYAGTNKLEFLDASNGSPISVASPVFAYVSLNGNGYGFDQDFDILSFGDGTTRDQGYFGPGTSYKNVTTVNNATQYQLLGTGEPHGTLQFRGSFSTVTWQSLSNEYWNGFTIGVASIADDIPVANAGPDQTVTASSGNQASVQLAGSVTGSTKTPFTFAWSGSFGTASGQNPTVNLPVGTNTITLTVTDAAGASDTDTVVITVLPNPAPVITSANSASGAYGSAFSYTITATNSPTGFGATGLPSGLALNGAVISGTPTQTGSFGIQLSASNSGGTGTGLLVLTINKANATVVVTPYSVTYDGQPHAATVSITGVNGETGSAVGTVTLNSTHTDAGTYSDTWSFTDAANHYNSIAATTITDKINKANATVSVSGYTGTYDGAAHGASGSATAAGGANLSGSLNLGGSFTNAPGGNAHWTFTGGTNYNDQSGDVAITINKANAAVVVTPYTVEYDGSAHSASVASITGVNGEAGAMVGAVALSTTHTNVGVYADSWSFTGGTNYNNIAATAITDVIQDTTAPAIASVTPSSATLWPPNHQMVAITVNAVATDLVGVTSLKIVNVTSSEPDNGLGDGDTAGDIVVTGNLTLQLRAERNGKGNGRVYTITVEARDAAGNASTKACTVSVPKSQGGR